MNLFASNHTCPNPPSLTEHAQQNIFGNYTFHHFAVILGGGAAGISCAIILHLMGWHATHLSKPREQYKILKICLLIPFYSFTSFLSICFPTIYINLNVWFSYFEAVAMATLFLLMCEYISPSQSERELFFVALKINQRKGPGITGNESLAWYRGKWIAIFQLPIVAFGVAVGTNITQSIGVYCQFSTTKTKPLQFAHFWLNLVATISLTFAFLSVIQFYMALKSHIARHTPLAKIIAFKMIVGLTFFENIIFWILQDLHKLNPTAKLTFADLNIGIPCLIICLQNIPLAIFFHYAYPYTPYILPMRSGSMVAEGRDNSGMELQYLGGYCGWKAWLSVFNPLEVARGILFTFKIASHQNDDYRDTAEEANVPLRHFDSRWMT